MKRIIYIAALLLPLISGCSKQNSPQTPEQYGKYIFFSHSVDTKAALIESAEAMGQFGVVGFKYDKSTSWDSHKAANPTPNVFYEGVETLTCDTYGSASYEPLQGWSNTKKYSFFAYYPLESDYVTLVNTDGTSYTNGTPAIKYSVNADDLNASMIDVMTAPAHTDKYWNSSSDNNIDNSDITFAFVHRLSALGLHIKNSTSGTITLNSAAITISGLQHQNIIIPLDGTTTRHGSDDAVISGSKTCSVALADSEKSTTSTGVELADKLIFIPQTEEATITVTLGFTRSADGYTAYDDTFTSPSLTTELSEGKKHMIYLKFTDSTVEVEKLTSGAWVDIPEVEDTFN